MRTAVTKVALGTPALVLACVLGPALVSTAAPERAAAAEEKKEQPKVPADAEAPTAAQVGESGLVVVRDPETGELRAPLGGEAADLLGAVPADNQSDAGLVAVPLPGGGFTVNLQGRFQSYFVVTRQADGTLKATCHDNHDQAEHALKPHAPASSAARGEDR